MEERVPEEPEGRVQRLLELNEEIEELRCTPGAAVHAPLATLVTLAGAVLMTSTTVRLFASAADVPWIWFMILFTGITAVVLAWLGIDLLAAQLDHRKRLRHLEGRLEEEEERLARVRRGEEVSPRKPRP